MNNNPLPPNSTGSSVESKLGAAAALHQKMQLAEAQQAYREVLQAQPQHVDALYALGVIAYQQRDLTAAADWIGQALVLKPDWVEAHNNLAVIFTELKQFEAACKSYDRAIALKPDYAEAYCNRGIALRELQQFAAALQSLEQAIALKPGYAEAYDYRGDVLSVQGKVDAAAQSYQEVVRLKPDSVSAHNKYGTTLCALGRYADAAAIFRLALRQQPNDAVTHANLGNALLYLRELDDALASLQHATQIQPSFAEAHFGRGVALYELKRFDTALQSLERAITLKAGYVEAYEYCGDVLCALRRFEEAQQSYREALAQKPGNAQLHGKLGNALRELGRTDDAVESLQHARDLDPAPVAVHNNLGNALRDLLRFDEALACYRRALEIEPENAILHANLGKTLADLGRFEDAIASFENALRITPDDATLHNLIGNAWRDLGSFDTALNCYRRAIQIKPDYFHALSNILFTSSYLPEPDAADALAQARHFGEVAARQAHTYTSWPNSREPERRLRIGLLSGDLRNHPVGYFVESVMVALAANTSTRLEFLAYANHYFDDALSQRIKPCFSAWRSVITLADVDLAALIREDRIDILIDLSGHTGHNRLPMLAWKPAPVQASWLGYFATTGVAAIDYLIADPWTVPESDAPNFTEQIWRLPESRLCFTAPDVAVEVGVLPALQNGAITFGCFNNLSKMNDAVVALWAQVLLAVSGSRLFLKAKQLNQVEAQNAVRERFAQHGIDGTRLILEGFTSRSTYLDAYQRVDIALDPFPYTGGTTTVEALWMGVPVLTLSGQHFLSRQGNSLLMNAGLPEWIAADAADYVARAISHTADRQRLSILRQGLRQQVSESPLFDATRFAMHFEAALRGMWRNWCASDSAQARTRKLTGGFKGILQRFFRKNGDSK